MHIKLFEFKKPQDFYGDGWLEKKYRDACSWLFVSALFNVVLGLMWIFKS
jgi:hypothetical protein